MPFMVGIEPVRRTLRYLKKCKIIFRDNVRIFSISYSYQPHSLGAKELVFWNLPQIQYNNPTVQCVKLKNLTATPFIKVYLEDEEPVLIDLDSRTREDILTHLENLHTITKTKEEIQSELKKTQNKSHPSFFGSGCMRHCICEIPGQVVCPNIVMLPKHWRGLPPKEPQVIIPPWIQKWGKEMEEKQSSDKGVKIEIRDKKQVKKYTEIE